MDAFPQSHPIQQLRPSDDPSSLIKQPPPPPPVRSNLFQQLWHWWATFTGPRKDSFKADIFAQERLRRARLVSALLILIVVIIALLLPGAYPSSPSLWIPIIALFVGGVTVALCNRAGYTTISSICFVSLVDITLVCFFYLKPEPALNSADMTTFDLFILAVLIGGVILPKVLIPLTGMIQVLLIITIFFLRPYEASMVALIQLAGNRYVALVPTFVLLLVGTTLAWLHAWSVERALVRASKAEELVEARAELSQQAILIAKQKQRLQEGISSILETHRQVAAGNLAVRAPVHEDQELWQIGHALNLLLMRFQQQTQDYRSSQATYHEIEQCIRLLDVARAGARPSFPPFHTPLAQRLLIALRR